MADWNKGIAVTTYRFMRVSRATGQETERLSMLKGGTITRNNDVRIMESAEVGVVGEFDIGPDLVRVYMTAEFADGTSEDVMLGTFLPVVPSREVNAGYSTATVKLYGRLQELLDDKFSTPVHLEKGTNAVQAAADVIRQQGLDVIADPSDYTITDPRSYGFGAQQNNSETGDTKLDMVNDLLTLADFRAAKTDPSGTVLLKRYVDPMAQSPSWAFREGANAKFESRATDERDITSAANHVVVRYETEGEVVVGEAYDEDPDSDLSTVSRGRVITSTYSYTSLPPGDTAQARQDYANRRASTLLETAQSVIRRVTISNAYAPVTVNDTVEFSYPSGGIEGPFEIRVQKMSLVGGCRTETELRQFRR